MKRFDAPLFAILLVLIGGAAGLAQFLSSTPLVGYDDADIFFVYARNLAAGHGFVYSVGGERVEGFTSLAWVVICTAATTVSSHPEIILVIFNVVLVAIAAYALTRYTGDFLKQFGAMNRLECESIALLLTAAAILIPSYVVWTTVSLMDFGLWSAVLLLCAIDVLRLPIATDGRGTVQRLRFVALLCVLPVIRPEAMLWAPVFIALAVLAEWSRGGTFGRAARGYALPVAALTAVILGQTAFRLAYFGYPLPNTFYAKSADNLPARLSSGATYFADFAFANPAFALALVVGSAILFVGRRRARDLTAAERPVLISHGCLIVILITAAVIPILEGGDHFGLWRMYQPVWPLVAVAACHAGVVLVGPHGRGLRGPALVYGVSTLVIASGFLLWPLLPRLSYPSPYAPGGAWNTPRVEMSIAQDMREIGAEFNRTFPSYQPRVGVIVAGGFALAYRGTVIDLMGLNNVAMAHSTAPRIGFQDHVAFDPDVFFSLEPDIVLLSLWSPHRPDWFGFPMMSGAFDAPPESRPDYGDRRASSMAAFDAGVLKGVLREPRMAERYAWASVRLPADGRWIHALFSRPCLERLAGLGYLLSYPDRVS